MKKISLIIADDHQLVRQTWAFILNADSRFEVLAECGSGEESLELVNKYHPDIVIMDVNLPGMNGIDATEQIITTSPATRILGVSLHTQPTYARKMMQKGASGYLTKNSSKEEMFSALAEIASGKTYICHEIKNILTDQMVNNDQKQDGFHDLSSRELEIIGHLKKGLSSREIGEQLGISAKTVEVHRYNILKKLNLRNTAALVNYINKNQPELG